MATALDKMLKDLSSEGNGFSGVVNVFNDKCNPLRVCGKLRGIGLGKEMSRKVAQTYEVGFYNPLMDVIKYTYARV